MKMTTTGNLNLRTGPSTTYAVLLVMPAGAVVDVLNTAAQTGFLNVRFSGTAGWASTKYLEAGATTTTPAPSTGVDGPPSPDNAIARASASVGFSYFWGGGSWSGSGATSSNKGSCSGNCPSHSGKYGADCSGMVGKAWQFGNTALEVNSHPYSTVNFVNDVAGKWSTISRGALKRGDAMVYNSNGAGHIVLWEKGDGWGTSTVYECRGCSYGCVHNARAMSSAYKAIRRAGF
jgi:cell wall-associated NlpC family hydrolase